MRSRQKCIYSYFSPLLVSLSPAKLMWSDYCPISSCPPCHWTRQICLTSWSSFQPVCSKYMPTFFIHMQNCSISCHLIFPISVSICSLGGLSSCILLLQHGFKWLIHTNISGCSINVSPPGIMTWSIFGFGGFFFCFLCCVPTVPHRLTSMHTLWLCMAWPLLRKSA